MVMPGISKGKETGTTNQPGVKASESTPGPQPTTYEGPGPQPKVGASEETVTGETWGDHSYLIPFLEVIGFETVLNLYDRNFIAEKIYGTTFKTFEQNFKMTPVVDADSFQINQLYHPYQGAMSFGFGRSAGLSYWQSLFYSIGGSELWFGIRNDGVSIGLDATTKTLRDISQAISAHIEPKIFPHVTLETRDARECVRVAFSGKEAPYFAYGRAFMRVADEDRQLSARELENLILSKNSERLRWDNKVCPVSVGDLGKAKLRKFIKRAGLAWDTPVNALEKLGLLHGGKLVNAAPLFFARKPPLQLRCAVFMTTESSTIIDRHDVDGDVLELIEEAQKYILKNIHIGMRLDGLYRVDVPEISVDAIREAIINAFCHRDYRDPEHVQVAIFKNRVEIRNPGRLFGSLTLADLRKGNVSQRRNPLIADLFRRIEMVEAWGRGMPLIMKNAPDVVFREVGNLFIVSFNRPSYVEGSDAGGETRAGMKVPTSTFPTESSVKQFGKESSVKTGRKILDLLSIHRDMTIRELARTLHLTTRAVEKQIVQLRTNKQLLRTGGRKLGRWEVVK